MFHNSRLNPCSHPWWIITSVRNSNLGLCFFAFKCCVSQLSVDRFGKNFEGVMTLGQVKSSPNFCAFGPQRAEKRNIWRRKNTILNLNSGLWIWFVMLMKITCCLFHIDVWHLGQSSPMAFYCGRPLLKVQLVHVLRNIEHTLWLRDRSSPPLSYQHLFG